MRWEQLMTALHDGSVTVYASDTGWIFRLVTRIGFDCAVTHIS